MRCLRRNRKRFAYALYTGSEAILDANGYPTGEYRKTYGPKKFDLANIAPSLNANGNMKYGSVTETDFGTNLGYTRVLLTERDFNFDEETILWIDDPDGEMHDYIVVSIAQSLNLNRYAIAKVMV